ncbi:nitrogen fixation protein NifX [Geotalea uraniireducens]|uniref:Nitrogen fixation protein NifX n=1 Tax=Geotalea uraniireducens TaxID=351604 RepID=A0ABM8EGQ8_9BACT|nr:NifB/NifX family molybdenum-iron cluster-binding protein [Geotalea uraniireducens]BDV41611.1 nitrogen fixation protein NifX [Geotalea uraniireducens]
MKIAFASNDGTVVNESFEEARAFTIWEIGADHATFCGDSTAMLPGDPSDEPHLARISMVGGCVIVCSLHISTVVLAKLVAQKSFHLNTVAATPISDIIDKLQEVLRGNPPPWLKKAMGTPARIMEQRNGC